MATYDYDVVIAGGSFGGCAAALAAAAGHAKVVLLEAGDWVGGQATSQGVTRWDETAADLTETTGSPRSYRELRNLIRESYAGVRSELGRQQQYFNPGFAGVGPPFARGDQHRGHSFAADPKLVQGLLVELLHGANVVLRTRAKVEQVHLDGTRLVKAVDVRTPSGVDTYTGRVFLDATDLGELLPLSGVKWVIGAEARSDTQEDDAEDIAHSEYIQPLTVPIAVQYVVHPDKPQLIGKPRGYDDIKRRQDFDRLKRPATQHGGDGDISRVFNPGQEEDTLINYRQFIDPTNFNDGRPWRTTLNVGSNDYVTRAIPTRPHSDAGDAQVVDSARAVSTAYVYYLQHEVPRDDGKGNGYPEIQIDTATFDTADGLARAPYIRESRRLGNPYVRVVEDDIAAEAHGGGYGHAGSRNAKPLGVGSKSQRAKNFRDSCGIGQYPVDVHPGYCSPDGKIEHAAKPNIGTPWHGFETVPFQVPLGALLPRELDNFVAACKNIGTTHLTSGAYRVHPVEWAIGEGAGTLAAYCVARGETPGTVIADPARVMAYQTQVLTRGGPIFWWDDVRFEDDAEAFAAAQLLGEIGVFEGDGSTRLFHGKDPFPSTDRPELERRLKRRLPGATIDWPEGDLNFSETALAIYRQLKLPVPSSHVV